MPLFLAEGYEARSKYHVQRSRERIGECRVSDGAAAPIITIDRLSPSSRTAPARRNPQGESDDHPDEGCPRTEYILVILGLK
jgi:hypothetical protein